jgi:hypothetical protein
MALSTVPGSDSRENDEREAYLEGLSDGRFDLGWLHDERWRWGASAERRKDVGITLKATNKVEPYGKVEDVAPHKSMAPRGAFLEEDLPSMGYTYNHKYQVWAENVEALYDEAISRQWDATRDIPWNEFETLPPELERSMCQVATLLAEIEFIASDFPAKWSWRMNQHFHEVKMFLATQAMDEARHLEVFRKRALANGGGLGLAARTSEQVLAMVINADSYIKGSFLMHVLGEGIVLDVFRAGEFLSPTDVDKKIFRMCMQDEARHVSYGTMHLKYFLQHHPDPDAALAELHGFADEAETIITRMFTSPSVVEPFAVLAGEGVDGIEAGLAAVRLLWTKIAEEYYRRCERAGFDRRDRSMFPAVAPF